MEAVSLSTRFYYDTERRIPNNVAEPKQDDAP